MKHSRCTPHKIRRRAGRETLAFECEKWKIKHIVNVNDIYNWEKFCNLETPRVYF